MLCASGYFVSWILGLLFFNIKCTFGCQRVLITNVSLPTELQSDVLLPCSFQSDLLNSDQTNQTCVVWTHLTAVNPYIVEIGLDGIAKFWENRGRRIKTESKLLDFSIRIRNVQQSDLGVYHCELFREIGCLLAYKRIELHTAVVSVDYLTWLVPTVATGGAVVLLVLLIIACTIYKCKKNKSDQIYMNTSHIQRAKFTKEEKFSQFLQNPLYS